MRSELIALEDKYYILEAKYRDATGQSSTSGDDCDPLTLPTISSGQTAPSAPAAPNNSDIQIQIDPGDSTRGDAIPAAPNPSLVHSQLNENDVQFVPPRQLSGNSSQQNSSAPQAVEANVNYSAVPTANQFEGALAFQQNVAPSEPGLIDPLHLRADKDGFGCVVRIPRDRFSIDGTLTLSVLDPHQPQESQRIGWWRLHGDELGTSTVSVDGLDAEFPLQLAWNLQSPQRGELMLFVRWEDPAHGSLEFSLPIQIESAAPAADDEPNEVRLGAGDWRPNR